MTNSIEVKQMIGGDTTEVESKTAAEGGGKVEQSASGSNESFTSTICIDDEYHGFCPP